MAEVFTIAGAPQLGATSCPAGWTLTPNGNCGGTPPKYIHPAAMALQKALAVIGKATGDRSLAVRQDGIVGPITTAAVNKALTAHLGPGQAPAALRTGALTINDVAQNAPALVQALNAEAARRGKAPALPPGPETPPVPPPEAAAAPSPALWVLVGVNLLVAAVGAYSGLKGEAQYEEEEPRRRRARRPAYA